VEGGGVGESRGVTSKDILLSINGIEVKSSEEVYQILSTIKGKDATVSLRLKRLSFEQNHFFTYRDRIVPFENLAWITLDDSRDTGNSSQTLAETK
jgi:hypothetical protein